MQSQELTTRQPMTVANTTANNVYLPIQEMFQVLENADSQLAQKNKEMEEKMTLLFQQMQITIQELATRNRNLEVELNCSHSRLSEGYRVYEANISALNNELNEARNAAWHYSELNQQLTRAHQQQIAQYQKQAADFAQTKQAVNQALSGVVQQTNQLIATTQSMRNGVINPYPSGGLRRDALEGFISGTTVNNYNTISNSLAAVKNGLTSVQAMNK